MADTVSTSPKDFSTLPVIVGRARVTSKSAPSLVRRATLLSLT